MNRLYATVVGLGFCAMNTYEPRECVAGKVNKPAHSTKNARQLDASTRKQNFINACTEAHGRIYNADKHISAWIAGITVAYEKAWRKHESIIQADAKNQPTKNINGLILDAALTFLASVPGGNAIALVMKNMSKKDSFLSAVGRETTKDGVKLLLKSTSELLITFSNDQETTAQHELFPLDESPLTWNQNYIKRINAEFAILTSMVSKWRKQVDNNDPSLDMSLDPVSVVAEALKLDGKDMESYRALTPQQENDLADTYERGFCKAWLSRYSYHTILAGDWASGYYCWPEQKDNINNMIVRCRDELDLDITPYLNKSEATHRARADRIMYDVYQIKTYGSCLGGTCVHIRSNWLRSELKRECNYELN